MKTNAYTCQTTETRIKRQCGKVHDTLEQARFHANNMTSQYNVMYENRYQPIAIDVAEYLERPTLRDCEHSHFDVEDLFGEQMENGRLYLAKYCVPCTARALGYIDINLPRVKDGEIFFASEWNSWHCECREVSEWFAQYDNVMCDNCGNIVEPDNADAIRIFAEAHGLKEEDVILMR